MSITTDIKGNSGRVLLSDLFDFRIREEFKAAYTPFLGNPILQEIVVDLKHVDYIDSTALGMLLILKDAAATSGKKISVFNATKAPLHVLKSAKFDQLLSIGND